MEFLDVVMEAKRKKRTVNIKQPETKSTDYTEEVEEPEEEDQEEQEETTDTDDTSEEDLPEDNEPTDYTEDTPEDDDGGDTVESDEAEPVEGEGGDVPEETEPTDYTEDAPEDGEGGDTEGDTGTEDGGDGTTDDTGSEEGDTPSDEDVETAEDSTEETEDDARNKRLLQEDYIDLFFRTKDFITKLSTLDKTNIILNQITVQIDKNLNRLKKALWDYVVYEYDKTTYITNLYKYNQFIEAFKVNLEMLSLAREHLLKEEEFETKKAKRGKRGR